MLGIVIILYSVLALQIAFVDGSVDLVQIDPSVDVFHYFLNGELQLDSAFFFEAFPVFPILKPLPKQIQLVGIDIAVVWAQWSADVDRYDLLVASERLFGTWGFEFEQEEAALYEMLDGIFVGFFFGLDRLLWCFDELLYDGCDSVELEIFIIFDILYVADSFDQLIW